MKQQLFTTGDAVSAACAVSTKRRGRLLAMAAGILSVLILLVTAMQFVILAGADRYSEYSDDCRKFMMDYMKKSSSYDTLVNKTYSPYRNYVESLGRDTLFQADLVAWKIATFDLKNGATQVTNSKEYKYYLGILMDLLSECTQDKDFLGKVKDVSDASHVSTVKAVMNFDEKYNNLYMKLNPSEADEIKNVLSEISSIQSFLGTVSNFKDLIEQAKNLDDLLYKLSQAQVIYDLMTGYGDTMQDMYNRCDDDNPALKAALLTVRDLCNQSMSKVNMVTLFAGGTVAEEGLKVALGAVQKEIVNAMGLTGAAITLAQSAGKMYANALFGTEDMLTAYYQMDALYDIENLVRLSLAWADDADSFFSAFSLYENIIYKGVTYSENYMKSIYEDSVVGVLFAWASGKDKEYEVFKSNMTSFKVDTFASFSSLQKSAYNAFINSKYTSDISNYFTVTDLYTLPSDEEIKQNDEEIERLSIQACGLPDEDYTLNDDLTILNNLYHSNGTIDLNGHTLTINGDLILEDGGINVNGGELIIKGNYNAYKATTNKDGTITYSAGGYLSMNNINDKVTVEGDFDTYSDYKTEYWDCLIFGEIEIKGNLIDHYNGGSTTYGLYSNGTKFIFSGTGKQTIKATDGYIYFENVEFVNKDTTGSIEFDNTKISCHIEKNETVTGNLCIEDMDLKGHKLTVNGDMKLLGGLWLNGGELYITGNYDAYIPVKNADGTTSYTGGQLVTSNVNDKVTVDGDFDTYSDYKTEYWDCLIFGEIEIKGNLIDHYNDGNTTYGLYSYGTQFIFSGTGTQTITALDGKLVLNTAEFVNKNVQIACSTEIDVDVPVRVHDYSDEWTVDVEAACNDGSKSHHCTRCDAKKDITVISATGNHKFGDWVITEEATCTAEGTQTRTCSVCNKVETQTIAALGHNYSTAWTTDKAATCGTAGSKSHHCTRCGDKKDVTAISATGNHKFGNWTITKAATCTAEGTQTRTCSVCGKFETATIAKIAHKYVNTVVKPTYTAKGYTLHKCSVCGTSYKDTYTAKLTLAQVTGVKLGGRAADALRVNWTKNANASGYIVEMYQGNKWVRVAKITSNATTTYRASGLKASTVYKFRVRAYKMEGKAVAYGAYSTELAARTNPSVMTGVKLSGRAADALRINWSKNASADGYIIEMYQGGKWVRVAKITSNSTTTFRKAGLKASTVYKFRVRAYKMEGKTVAYGAYSTELAARTNPSVMTGAKLGGRAADALRINWTKNTSADGYIVEMYQNGKWVRVAKITNGNTTTFRKAGLKASSVYKFRVRAYKMSGKTALYGNYSATVTARTNPSVMKGVKIAGKAKDALRVNWTKNASAQGYIVEMYKGGKWVRVAKITNSNTTTFRKAGLAKNTAYKFRVCAYYMSGKTALYGNYGSVSGKTAAK